MSDQPKKRSTETVLAKIPDLPRKRLSTGEIRGLAHLVVFYATRTSGAERGHSYTLRDRAVIGRDPDVDVILDFDDVSRRHALIEHDESGAVTIRDLGSVNGTIVNDTYVEQPVELRPGDMIKIGSNATLLFTRYHPLETQMMQSQKLESLGRLAAGIGHEINNPLAFVSYNLEVLTRSVSRIGAVLADVLGQMLRLRGALGGAADPDQLEQTLRGIEDAADPAELEMMVECLVDAKGGVKRIKEIVQDVQAIARMEADRLHVVEVNGVMDSAIKLAHNQIKFRARLVKEYGEGVTTLANEGRLAQVFLNLLLNAAHAMKDDALERNEISVRTRVEGQTAMVEVSDNGRGIEPQDLQRVFEPFFTTKSGPLGSGLGLSICHNIIESLGGTIEVASAIGIGTAFTIHLPLTRQARRHRRTISQPPLAPESSAPRGRVLVVDDEVDMGIAIMRLLLDYHDVEAVRTGMEAQQLLEADQAFDLVLCDLLMPKYTGMDLYAWIERRFPTLVGRVAFMSGGAFTDRSMAFVKQTDSPVLSKPVELSTLLELIAGGIRLRGA